MSFTSLNFYVVYNSRHCINAHMLTFTCTMIVILLIKCHMQIYMVSGSSLSVKATQNAITYSQIVILLYFTTIVFLIIR